MISNSLHPRPLPTLVPRVLILVIGAWLLSSCEPSVGTVEYEEKLVVFGNLTAYAPFVDTVFVSLSYGIDEPHEGQGKWVSDASVTIMGGGVTLQLPAVPERPGRYLGSSFSQTVLPNTEYDLEVEWGDYDARAATLVPDTVSIESIVSSGWECNGAEVAVPPINLHLGENSQVAIEEAVRTGDFSLLAMDTVIYKEGSCYASTFASIPMFAIGWSSEVEPGMLRAISLALEDTLTHAIVDTSLSANAFKGPMYVDDNGYYYRPNPVVWNLSQGELHFGWLSFNYYGVHLIMIQATDRDFNDYFQGDPLRQNQYVLPNSNVEGGYGLFSSLSTRAFLVYVAPETSGD